MPAATLEVTIPAKGSLLLSGLTWDDYVRLSDEYGRPGLRLTYDRGRLEIMPTSLLHDWIKRTLGRLIETWCDETGTSLEGFGSATNRSQLLDRGLEPDECYYVRTPHPHPTTPGYIDPSVMAPPDLAIEVDITSSSVSRESVYAAFGVPELIRYADGEITSLHLQKDGTYLESETSFNFPDLPLVELSRWLRVAMDAGKQQAGTAAVREWVRARK